MSLSFRVRVRHDAPRAIARVEGYPPRLDAAMRRGTERGTTLLAAGVRALVVSRTSMDEAQAAAITKSEVLPGVGPLSRGRVWFTKPPDRFYPKRGEFLRFKGQGGREVFARSVRGSRPYVLIERATGTDDTADAIEEGYREEIEEVL